MITCRECQHIVEDLLKCSLTDRSISFSNNCDRAIKKEFKCKKCGVTLTKEFSHIATGYCIDCEKK